MRRRKERKRDELRFFMTANCKDTKETGKARKQGVIRKKETIKGTQGKGGEEAFQTTRDGARESADGPSHYSTPCRLADLGFVDAREFVGGIHADAIHRHHRLVHLGNHVVPRVR